MLKQNANERLRLRDSAKWIVWLFMCVCTFHSSYTEPLSVFGVRIAINLISTFFLRASFMLFRAEVRWEPKNEKKEPNSTLKW